MKFKTLLLALITSTVFAAHTTDRKMYITDITDAAGNSILKLPTASMSSGGVVITNADAEVATDSNFLWDATNKKATLKNDALTTTSAAGLLLQNSTAASSGSVGDIGKVSPSIILQGQGYKASPSASQSLEFHLWNKPVQTNTSTSQGSFMLSKSSNSGALTDLIELKTYDTTIAAPRTYLNSGLVVNLNGSNSTPSTVDQFVTKNPSGSYTHWVSEFNGVQKFAISSTQTGDTAYRTAASNGHVFHVGTFPGTQIAQIFSNGFYNSFANFNGGKVTAGQANQSSSATLSNYGSYASKGDVIVSSTYTIPATGSTEQFLYCDTTSASSCTGTASACSSFSYASCNTYALLGCSQNTTGTCSDYSSTDSSTCTGADASCSWQTASCSAYNNDSASCTAAGFPSGGFCTFTPNVCSDYASSEATCNAASGCAADMGACSAFDNTDQATCEANAGCSYAGDPVCSGTYYLGTCSGTYAGADGACTGTYDTGTCSGGAFGTCSGSSSCSGLTASGSATCNSFGPQGCSWTTGMQVNLPSIETHISSGTGYLVGLKKVNTGSGSVTITPAAATSDTIEGDSTHLLTNKNQSVILHPMRKTADCLGPTTDPACTNQGGSCTLVAAIVCADLMDESSCNTQSGAGCSWDGMACSGAGTAAYCSGTYVAERTWMRWAEQNSLTVGQVGYGGTNGRLSGDTDLTFATDTLSATKVDSLTVNKGVKLARVSKGASYTLTVDDYIVVAESAITLTLPTAVGVNGQTYVLKSRYNNPGNTTINTTSGQTLDGMASGVAVLAPGESITVFSNGTNWEIE